MFDFKKLEKRYMTDAAFNKLTNLFRQMFEEFGFLPDEIRQASFLAQWQTQFFHVKEVIRTQDDMEKEALARAIMQQAILKIQNLKDLNQPPPEGDAE